MEYNKIVGACKGVLDFRIIPPMCKPLGLLFLFGLTILDAPHTLTHQQLAEMRSRSVLQRLRAVFVAD